MRSEYFGSAKVTYFDADRVWDELRRFAAQLGETHPEITRIAVFGSLPAGRAVPGSDVDLLVIVSASDLPFLDRGPVYRPDSFPVGVDVFAYTEEEARQMLAEGNSFLRRVLAEAVTLFERVAD
jgi:predicted nucleotidyltransferase